MSVSRSTLILISSRSNFSTPKKPICQTKHYSDDGKYLSFMMTHDKQLCILERKAGTLLTSKGVSEVKEMTLRQILDTVVLTICAKRMIGLVLARTLLHLLGGKWVVSPITLNSISFYYATVGGKPLFFFDRAFLFTEFARGEDGSESSDGIRDSPLNAIQALGVILAKIELGENYSRAEDEQNLSRYSVNPLVPEEGLLQLCNSYSASPPSSIGFCLNPSSFGDYEGLDGDNLLKDRGFVSAYYRGVIRPLEGWLIKNNWSWKQVNWLETYAMDDKGICHIIGDLKAGSIETRPHPTLTASTKPALILDPIRGLDDDVEVELSGQPPGCVMDYKDSTSTLPPGRA